MRWLERYITEGSEVSALSGDRGESPFARGLQRIRGSAVASSVLRKCPCGIRSSWPRSHNWSGRSALASRADDELTTLDLTGIIQKQQSHLVVRSERLGHTNSNRHRDLTENLTALLGHVRNGL